MQNYQLLELEVSYARPQEITRKLELARLSREGRISRTGLRERAFLPLSDVLMSLGQELKARWAPLGAGAAAR
jgi:hypothetical protein